MGIRGIIVIVTITPTMIIIKVENIIFLFKLFTGRVNSKVITQFIFTSIKNKIS